MAAEVRSTGAVAVATADAVGDHHGEAEGGAEGGADAVLGFTSDGSALGDVVESLDAQVANIRAQIGRVERDTAQRLRSLQQDLDKTVALRTRMRKQLTATQNPAIPRRMRAPSDSGDQH